MADALVRLMQVKEFSKITVNEISATAGVNRSTWFRNFSSKNDALIFRLVLLWNRWADERGLKENPRYTIDNSPDFFLFCYQNRSFLGALYSAGLETVLYESFHRIIMPQYEADADEYYQGRFYSYGLFGMLDEWLKRDFKESPEDMTRLFYKIMNIPSTKDR